MKLNFWSVLYIDEREEEEATPDIGEYIHDLNFDLLADAIFGRDDKYKDIFFTPLRNEESILYRLDFLKDLENPQLFSSLEKFHQKLESSLRKLHLVRKLDYKIHKSLWFLESTLEYADAINSFLSDVENGRYSSKALSLLIEHVSIIKTSSLFGEMERYQKRLKDSLDKFAFLVHIKESRIEVYPYENLNEVKGEAEKLFSFLDFEAEKVEEPELFVLSGTSRLESRILEEAFKYTSGMSKKLQDFYTKFQNFFDDKLEKFVREFSYYIKLRKFFKDISRSYPVSIPELSVDKTGQFQNFYNVVLAHKVQCFGVKVVTNNLYIDSDEKIFVITGPNQGGKTTYAKALGQIMHLIRIGSYIPASYAKGWMVSKILTHFEEQEDVKENKSMLEKELYRMRDLIKKADENSLVIINEAFSSTTLEDALFISKKTLVILKEKESLCFWVTFFYELAGEEDVVSLVSQVDKNSLKRTYKIVRTFPKGKAYALPILEKYSLTYDDILERMKNNELAQGG
ncbi:MAG: hypothetical protein J7L34_06825 [Thermotogaceae bacterium]|nr:hypothetical protein [Thermotogaceae bacterium]